VDQIIKTYQTESAKRFLDQSIVCQMDPLFLDHAEATLVDKIADCFE
jgi:hypothetical protein